MQVSRIQAGSSLWSRTAFTCTNFEASPCSSLQISIQQTNRMSELRDFRLRIAIAMSASCISNVHRALGLRTFLGCGPSGFGGRAGVQVRFAVCGVTLSES